MRLIWFITVLLFFSPEQATAELTPKEEVLIQTCLDKSFVSVLQGKAIAEYSDVPLLTKRMLGPGNYNTLTLTQIKQFEKLVLKHLQLRSKEKGSAYAGSTVKLEDGTSAKDTSFEIQGTITGKDGVPYFFQAYAWVSKKRCQFFSLDVEGLFKLKEWLRERPEIVALMKELKLKR